MRSLILFAVALSSTALLACASTPGAHPQDMSVAQHEQAAAAQEGEAKPHAAQYDPNAQSATTHCDGKHPCWTSTSNPTQEHMDMANRHRKMAADHRAAAHALASAEAQACAGLSEDDRDMSPFSHREDISGVRPAMQHLAGKQAHDIPDGAVVTFRAVPGLTAEWLQRIVDCHVARNSALGNDVPEMPYCPLVPKGITAKVSSAGTSFDVTIESQDPKAAQEVLRRAEQLKAGG